MNKLAHIGCLAIATLAIGYGCKQDDLNLDKVNTDFTRKLTVNAPVAKISFSVDGLLKKLVEDSMVNIITGANDTLFYAFEKNVKLMWNDLVLLPDVAFKKTISPLSLVAAAKSATAVTLNGKIKINVKGQRLDSVSFINGELAIKLTVPSGTSGSISILIPELQQKSTKAAFSKVITMGNAINRFPLSEYLAIPVQAVDSSYLNIYITPTFTGPSQNAIDFDLSMQSMGFDDVVGYFGQVTHKEKNVELDFVFFDEYGLAEKIEFADFKIELESHNYLGLPFKIETDSVWFSKAKDPQNAWELQFSPKYMNLLSASYNGTLTPSINNFQINKNNSPNIQQIGNKFPNLLVCNITGSSNPGNPTGKNFIKNNTTINNTLRLMFPFWFKTSNYLRTDTIDFDFNDITGDSEDGVDMIENLNIHFDFQNRFPFEIKLNVVAVDGNNKPIVNLVPFDSMIAGAIPDEGGKTNLAAKSRITVVIDAEKIELMRANNVKKIFLYSEGVTYNNGETFVVLFANSRMDLTVSLDLSVQQKK